MDCPHCEQKKKWERIRQRVKRAAEKAASGNRKDLRRYLDYRIERNYDQKTD